MDEEPEDVIDECSLSEWYTAHVFAKLFPKTFRYDGTRQWSYWDEQTQEWVPDTQRRKIKTKLRLEMSRKVLQRAKFWQKKVATCQVDDMHEASMMIQRLLTISQKLQTDVFLGKIIRELQEHYGL